MVIEPFNYQKRTNIEEHNQIVDKLNEVVDAVNNLDPSGPGLEPRVSALETDVTEIGARVDTVESQNLQQNNAIATLGQRVGATEDNVTGLTGRVGQLETDTTNLDGRVTDIDGRLTTLAGNYTTLGGRVDSINTEVGQLSTEVGGLETGKVNVAQGSENAGKYLRVGPEGNVTLEAIQQDFEVEYESNYTGSSFVPYGDNLYTYNMEGYTFTLVDTYTYFIDVTFTNSADADIDWYAINDGGFNIVFDRQPTGAATARIYGAVIR